MVSKKSKWSNMNAESIPTEGELYGALKPPEKPAATKREKILANHGANKKQEVLSVQAEEITKEEERQRELWVKHRNLNAVLRMPLNVMYEDVRTKKIVKHSFRMGDPMKPNWQDVSKGFKNLAFMYPTLKLAPDSIDQQESFLSVTRETATWLAPITVQLVYRMVQLGKIDALDSEYYALFVIVEMLAWYWHQFGGPRPSTNGLLHMLPKREIIQDEVLRCPCCTKIANPPSNMKFEATKMWWYTNKWLPDHLEEYHKWKNPAKRTKKVTPKA